MAINNEKYLISGVLYTLEALTERMSDKKKFYFLRSVVPNDMIIKVAEEELPPPYISKVVTIPEGALYSSAQRLNIAKEDFEVDINKGLLYPLMSKGGEFIYNGYYEDSTGGRIAVLAGKVIYQDLVPAFCAVDAEELTKIAPFSGLSGKDMSDPVEFYHNDAYMYADRKELIFSDYSDSIVPKSTGHWIFNEYTDKICTRQDIVNGLVEEYGICDYCNRIEEIEKMSSARDYDNVCEECLTNYFNWSNFCEDSVLKDAGQYVQSVDDFIHYNDLEKYFQQCEHCDRYFLNEDVSESTDGTWLCNECYENNCDADGYYHCHNNSSGDFINDYRFKPSPVFFGDRFADKYIGIEWEIQGGGESDRKAKKMFYGIREFYCKHDSSLNDGFEVVSHPCTTTHLLSMAWGKLTETAKNYGYDEEYGAGFHIHISRDHFRSTSEIGKLVRFFSENYDNLTLFGNRDWEKALDWASPTEDVGSDKFYMWYEEARGTRYRAINVQNSQTVEIRLFNTSYDADVIRSYIQFADCISDLANGLWKNMTFKNVHKLAIKRGYKELAKRLAQLNLI